MITELSTQHERSDREDLAMLEKYFAAHLRRGTTPHPATVRRFEELEQRINAAAQARAETPTLRLVRHA